MNILYTCDNNYVWLMGVSVISLFENNRDVVDITVYLLGENISEENKCILYNISAKYDRKIVVTDVSKLKIPDSLVSDRWPMSAFTRLYAGDLLPIGVEKVLYLDCDTIIEGSISILENIEMKENIFMGVKDCVAKRYKRNIGISDYGVYLNAGVLLIDLNKLRKIDIKYVIDAYMNTYIRYISFADQDMLNGIFNKKVGVLDSKFNVMTIDVEHSYEEIIKLRKPTNFYTKKELENAIKNPVIIHYTTNMLVVRPWHINTNHPLSKLFVKYKQLSPWRDKSNGVMKFTSKESIIIKTINILPSSISLIILGLIHAEIKPFLKSIKAKI